MLKRRINARAIWFFISSLGLAGLGIKHFYRVELPSKYDQALFDQAPEFPGGLHNISVFLKEHIIYPPLALSKNIHGRVFVRFRVDASGQVDNVTVMDSVDPLLDSEAVRVIRLLPRWKPGMLKNRPVAVYLMQPVVFRECSSRDTVTAGNNPI